MDAHTDVATGGCDESASVQFFDGANDLVANITDMTGVCTSTFVA
jgi:hypothetical protein